MYKRILVPLDGSENAQKVLPVVVGEATCHQATVVLLRVIPPMRYSLMMTPAILAQINQQATELGQSYLNEIAERLRAEGLEVETEIRSGPPAQSILDFAEGTGCDLIVIGSHGETGAIRWRFGSVANKIVRTETSMPVLVVNT